MGNRCIVHIVAKRPHGGIGSVLKNIELNRDPFLFNFIYLFAEDYREKSFDEYVRSYHGEVCVLPQLTFPFGFLKYIIATYSFYKKNAGRIVAVHVHAPNMALLHFVCAKFFKIRIRILHSHSTRYSESKVKGIINAVLVFFSKFFVTHKVACGKDAAQFFFGKHHEKDVFIFHNAIDTRLYTYNEEIRNKMREELHLKYSFVYGHVGNFYEVKNHSFLIDVFAAIKKQQPSAKLLLVGRGPLQKTIEEKVSVLGLQENVLFLGYRKDVRDLLMAMDIFLFPSLFEGFPVSLVEAQCTGLPCLISNTITSEVSITNLIKFLPIGQKNIVKWEETAIALSSKKDERKSYSMKVQNMGYNLKHEIESLDKYYVELCKEI